MNHSRWAHSLAELLAVLVGALSLYLAKNALFNYLSKKASDKKRNDKIASLDLAKKNFSKYLQQHKMDQKDIEMITDLPLLELVEKLRNQEIPPSYVLLAYQHKAFEVDKQLNCVTEFLYPELSEVNLKGPLAGVPVSLKECIGIKDYDSCCGCAWFIDHRQRHDAVALKIIRDLGGIPFVRTNVPQTMLSTQCSNPINGSTLNPLKLDRTPHGSSGGEAALVAGGGSILGFGTDLGGSVRLPAAMCGIVGFKPTTGRLSVQHTLYTSAPDGGEVTAHKLLLDINRLSLCLSSSKELHLSAWPPESTLTPLNISPTWGPICRDATSCQFVMEFIMNSPISRDLDPYSPPIPYQKIPTYRRLRIGYFLRFDKLVPVPAVRRALLHTRDKLIARGHELIEWTPPFKPNEFMNLHLKSIFSDGCARLKLLLKNDRIDPCMQGIYRASNMSWCSRLWLRFKLKWTGNYEDMVLLDALGGFSTVLEFESYILKLRTFCDRVMDSLRAASIDVLLCPVVGFAGALTIHPLYPYSGMLAFQSFANTLDIPAGCMPSGLLVERQDMEVLTQAVEGGEIKAARDDAEREFYSGYGNISLLHRRMLPLQEGTEGLPIPVQFMSLPWQDELCLYAMREFEVAKTM
ncbi:hypothetical protein Aperf_G00000055287 [Anoplocephala perfoliata]